MLDAVATSRGIEDDIRSVCGLHITQKPEALD